MKQMQGLVVISVLGKQESCSRGWHRLFLYWGQFQRWPPPLSSQPDLTLRETWKLRPLFLVSLARCRITTITIITTILTNHLKTVFKTLYT